MYGIFPPRGDKGGEVAVIWVDGNGVVSVPAVEDRLFGVAQYSARLVKGALCVMGFTCGMAVECQWPTTLWCGEPLALYWGQP